MPGSFEGRAVLITGASSGIGAALAREFARQGADVALAARREDRLRTLAAEIEAAGRGAIALTCDVSQDGDPERAVAAAVERFGRLDVAVANAGIGVTGRFDDLTLDDYRRQLETNVFGVLRTAYAALPVLKRNRGSLVILGSVSGYLPLPMNSSYCMSKFAVRAFAETARDELKADGVAVTLVSPGFVASDIRRTDNDGHVHEDRRDPIPAWLILDADKAARRVVRATHRRRRELILTLHGKLGAWAYRHVPWLVRLFVSRAVGERRWRGAAGQGRRGDDRPEPRP